jgi:hypothetical protein
MKMRPDLGSIHAAARRQRNLEMNRLIFAPIAAFFRRPKKSEPQRQATRVAACHS